MSLLDLVAEQVRRGPTRIALEVTGRSLSYEELWQRSGALARKLDAETDLPFCGLLAAGTAEAFIGQLAILRSGRAYVPLNPAFPTSRTAQMISAVGLDRVLVDRTGAARWAELESTGVARGLLLDPDATAKAADVSMETTRLAPRTDLAYVMFTSGSTGAPKGVMVSDANIEHFVRTARDSHGFTERDRFSQMFDLTFDLSLFDTFVCWASGATLCVVPLQDRMAPARFLRQAALTVWFSVPAVAGFMQQLKALRPSAYPALRWSLFCGEALPASVAEAWQAAAPASQLENLYGPTEVTVACTRYRWDPKRSPAACVNGVVPIGRPYDGTEVRIVGEALEPAAPGEPGELLLGGAQTAPGYWRNDTLTSERFVSLPSVGGRWYRTGDLVRFDRDGELIFLGRVDHQVKVLGYRVELGEIEACLRASAETQFAIAVPWPAGGAATGIVACLSGSERDDETILEACRRSLPGYMVPKRIVRLPQMPQNANGKIDRNRIRELIGGATHE